MREKAMELEGRAGELMAEAEVLKDRARLEDLALWKMEKARTTKKGQDDLWLLDGILEGRREGPERAPGKLHEDG
jgi:hypothetical protein